MRIFNKNTNNKINIIPPGNSVFRNLVLIIPLMFFLGNPLWTQGQISTDRDLAFGSFATGSTGGTVVVSPEGNRSVTGTIIPLETTPVFSAGFGYRIGGRHTIRIVFPQSAQLNRTGGNGSMTITNFTSDRPGNIISTRPGPPMTYTVNVGATLNVQNSTVNPGGDYTGTFTVTFINE
jgi:hypothetical protein